MILPVTNNNINFSAKEKKLEYSHDTLLKNNAATRWKRSTDKLANAITVYPAKGLKGNKNANFYEFLTMGSVPYIIGSITLMSIFNSKNKDYLHFDKFKASSIGQKMALGVLFYALMKDISKSFINKPVQMLTGIDTERPYARVIYELPDDINDTDITSIEHHKIFESVEFPRWDLLYGDESKGEARNYRYDRIAKKLGMGENLKDSDQEVKPRIKEVIIKSNLAKSISSYLWAATGVALAFQKPWDNYFNVMTFKFWKGKEFTDSMKTFAKSFKDSAKALYKGSGSGISKHSGKILLATAAASTIGGIILSVTSSKTPQKNVNVIDEKNGYTKA